MLTLVFHSSSFYLAVNMSHFHFCRAWVLHLFIYILIYTRMYVFIFFIFIYILEKANKINEFWLDV